jgi:hypothetical protein
MNIWMSSGAEPGLDWGLFGGLLAISYLVLVLMGIGYNALVGYLERKGHLEGYVSFSVVLGVLLTLVILYIPQLILSILVQVCLPAWAWMLITLAGFAASGTPMVVGSVARYLRERQAAIQAMKEEVYRD